MLMAAEQKPPLPPFTPESATQKVRGAEDAWNKQDPETVAMAYTADSWWRNRSTFVQGREQIVEFLEQKWARELNYRLIKEMWACTDNRIAVRYCYESQSDTGQWYRSYGNENWEFDDDGLMRRRHSSINDLEIDVAERKFHWQFKTPRPADHPGLSELGL
jgi:nuclear transport factor 2 (NTF2) superfamily protein